MLLHLLNVKIKNNPQTNKQTSREREREKGREEGRKGGREEGREEGRKEASIDFSFLVYTSILFFWSGQDHIPTDKYTNNISIYINNI